MPAIKQKIAPAKSRVRELHGARIRPLQASGGDSVAAAGPGDGATPREPISAGEANNSAAGDLCETLKVSSSVLVGGSVLSFPSSFCSLLSTV